MCYICAETAPSWLNLVGRIKECEDVIRYFAKRTPNSLLEIKNCGLCFHYRRVEGGFNPEKLYNLLKRIAGDQVCRGKDVIEVRSLSKDYVCYFANPAICAGDDVTDEDMFEVSRSISIRVGKGVTKADAYVENVNDFNRELLNLQSITRCFLVGIVMLRLLTVSNV